MTVPVEVRDKALVAMTVPVQTAETNGTTVMRFYLPAKCTPDSAPVPTNAGCRLLQSPERRSPSCIFPAGEMTFTARQTELVEKLRGSRWRPSGQPYTLYYDAPFTLPFRRRNEAAVAVIETL